MLKRLYQILFDYFKCLYLIESKDFGYDSLFSLNQFSAFLNIIIIRIFLVIGKTKCLHGRLMKWCLAKWQVDKTALH